ncbi:MAG: sugar kinase [Aureliella sp.]
MTIPTKSENKTVDVALFGETMLRLSPSADPRGSEAKIGSVATLEDASSMQAHVGGSESNTAVGLANLGHTVAWISRLTENPIGAKICREIRDRSVDVSKVIWTDTARIGTYYYQRAIESQPARVWYDRADSAFSQCTPRLLAPVLEGLQARVFHTTGISVCVSEHAFESTLAAVKKLHSAGSAISFDVNYRAKLLQPDATRRRVEQVLPFCSFVFIPRRDTKTIFGINSNSSAEAAKHFGKLAPKAYVIVTDGANGSTCRSPLDKRFSQSAYECKRVERLGLGDAFSAGFLSGWLRTREISFALRRAALMASLKYETAGDFPTATSEQIESEERNQLRKPLSTANQESKIER